MSFPRYPKYKDSGVEWLGEVPEHWGVSQLKRVVDSCRQITYGIVQAGPNYPGGIPYIRPADMTDEMGIVSMSGLLRTSPEIGEAYSRSTIQAGDLVCSIGPSFGKVMVTPAALGGANLTQGTARVAIACTHLARYFFWSLRSPASFAQWESAVGGATFRALNLGPLAETIVLIPPESEQAAIADFLDRETAKIDALVAEQQRLIELLKEKRQAVISRAVTKGLNPAAPMKASGIEWLGQVPVSWEIRRLSSITSKITNGYVGPTRDIFRDDGIRYLQSLHIKNNSIRFDTPYFVSEEWSNQHRKSILETGDLLIVQTGDIGQVAVVPPEYAGCNCHALIVAAPIRSIVEGEWIAWFLNSDYGYHTLLSIQTGALHPHLNCGDVKDIAITLPPKTEQRHIIEYVVSKTNSFNGLVSEATRAIALLRERRTALISSAVTGKIDVRGLVARDAA